MNKLEKSYIKASLFSICIISIFIFYGSINKIQDGNYKFIEIISDTVDLSLLELTKENFIFVCNYYEIKEPEIVYAQAQLESGRFTSKIYKSKNNFLGLYNSRIKDYYTFNHWSDCLKGYKNFVQSKWDGNCNYYTFLEKLPYAEDPSYIIKVQKLVNLNLN